MAPIMFLIFSRDYLNKLKKKLTIKEMNEKQEVRLCCTNSFFFFLEIPCQAHIPT